LKPPAINGPPNNLIEKKPEVKLPEGKLPEGKLPGVKLPEVKLPEVKLPEGKLPEGKLPVKIGPLAPEIKPELKPPAINGPPNNIIEKKPEVKLPEAKGLVKGVPEMNKPESSKSGNQQPAQSNTNAKPQVSFMCQIYKAFGMCMMNINYMKQQCPNAC
jgi:hypothetical protein